MDGDSLEKGPEGVGTSLKLRASRSSIGLLTARETAWKGERGKRELADLTSCGECPGQSWPEKRSSGSGCTVVRTCTGAVTGLYV
jgi:hypothetical protein